MRADRRRAAVPVPREFPHCFVDSRTGELIRERTIRAQVGSPDIRTSRIGVEVLRVYVPAEYKKSDGGMAGIYDKADVAVARLARSLVKPPDSCALRISPLPKSHVLGTGDTSLVAGYGCSRNENPTKLKYTMMKPIDHETCAVDYLLGEDDSVFCAVVTDANAGSAVCRGDDGTPYVHKSGVVGILSYVPSDRSSDAIFTKVGAYEQFIKRAMAEKIDHTIKVVDYRS
uniref:Peptidase S1 domain-containing protein n=1 Tax=Trichogramma kaykai TaxID=54128 RepID=A0ABD2XK09_9HYME